MAPVSAGRYSSTLKVEEARLSALIALNDSHTMLSPAPYSALTFRTLRLETDDATKGG